MNDAADRSYTYRRYVDTSLCILISGGKAREYCAIANEGSTVFIKLGPDVSLSDYTYRLPPGGQLEISNWAGPVSAIRSVGGGFLMCTETV